MVCSCIKEMLANREGTVSVVGTSLGLGYLGRESYGGHCRHTGSTSSLGSEEGFTMPLTRYQGDSP